MRHVGCFYYTTLSLTRELVSRVKLCLVSVFPDLVKDFLKIRNLPKIFLRSFEKWPLVIVLTVMRLRSISARTLPVLKSFTYVLHYSAGTLTTWVASYPSCCVRLCDPVTYPRSGDQSLYQTFISDVTARLPVRCRSTVGQKTVADLRRVDQVE